MGKGIIHQSTGTKDFKIIIKAENKETYNK